MYLTTHSAEKATQGRAYRMSVPGADNEQADKHCLSLRTLNPEPAGAHCAPLQALNPEPRTAKCRPYS